MPPVTQFLWVFGPCLVVCLATGFWIIRKQQTAAKAPSNISVVELLEITDQHSLILVRRDSSEHLILIAASADQIVETNIQYHNDPIGMSEQKLELQSRIQKITPKSGRGIEAPNRSDPITPRSLTKDEIHDKLLALADEIEASSKLQK